MAIIAASSIVLVVHIVDTVTVVTLCWSVFVASSQMAGAAGRFIVRPLKRKFCLIVIKPGFLPLFGAMTTVAVLAKCFSMDVVILVAVITVSWRFPELLSGFMAGIAGDSRVAACEFEVGHFMIEGLAVQTGNIHPPTDMVSVAAATLGVLDGAGSSM